MKWNELSSKQQNFIVEAYRDAPTARTLEQFSQFYEMPISTLQRRCQEALQVEEEYVIRSASLDAPPSQLTNFYWIDPDTDQGEFVRKLHVLQDDIRHVRVMHACDFHFPYHNPGAASLFYQLAGEVEPHLIAVGSDSADFSMISSFDSTDDDDHGDVLEQFDSYYTPHIHSLIEHSPNSILFFILGNHEKRIYDFILRQAPQVRTTVWNRFIEIIRVGGLVHWLGETDFARIGPLMVMHGNRTSSNPAKSMLEDLGYQASVMAGHVHRRSFFERRGEDFSVVSATSGCHCLYPPHWSKRKRMTSQWQLGTAVAEVDLQGREVVIENLDYAANPDQLTLKYRGIRYVAMNPRPSGLVTYEEYLGTQK